MKRKNLLKILRYISIYGLSRSIIKAIGRSNSKFILPNLNNKRTISIIGCGQFAFSTISYFLYFLRKGFFLGCYDIDISKARKMAKFYGFLRIYPESDALFLDKRCNLIYIASNHASHTDYAIRALKANKNVYVEKPVAVSFEQLIELKKAINESKSRIYIGYNRPFSNAIKIVSKEIFNCNKPLSICCFIVGHYIPVDHWYRNPEEGTRICGNLGHWLDLAIHLFSKRGHIPNKYKISISYANENESDDNILIGISTDFNDIMSILLTSRSEPFEGINETINIQCDKITVKIDDFRSMTIWKEHLRRKVNFRPKDVGHRNSIIQPFSNTPGRDFYEIEVSTLLMLKIKEMIVRIAKQDEFNLSEVYGDLLRKVNFK